jgi:omega-hydroxy-beta-dihydromenaquinone-9 sulfotransferase
MISFDFKLAFNLVLKALSRGQKSGVRLTGKRIASMLILFTFYVVNEIINWLCLLLDEILFSDYRDTPVKDPVFIVGFPRSGTTYIHRLLAKDDRFTTIRLWEILFAPSIFQKKMFKALGRLDRMQGNPIAFRIRQWEQEKLANVYHSTGLFEPEEDEFLLMHIFSSFFLIFMFPFYEDLQALSRFDLELPAIDRARIMNFYKRCVQRHLYVFGKNGKIFLSKNPAFSTKVQSLRNTFPGARFICMVRNPLESIPSTVSHMSFFFEQFHSPPLPICVSELVMNIARDYYRFPLSILSQCPDYQHAIIPYHILVNDPEKTLQILYDRFKFAVSQSFQIELTKSQQKASCYQSNHTYSPEIIGLEREYIFIEYQDIFEYLALDIESLRQLNATLFKGKDFPKIHDHLRGI